MQEAINFDKELVLIITDRAVIDLYVYLDDDEAKKIVGHDHDKRFAERYDYVLFFETTGEAQFLSCNNPSRHEKSYRKL